MPTNMRLQSVTAVAGAAGLRRALPSSLTSYTPRLPTCLGCLLLNIDRHLERHSATLQLQWSRPSPLLRVSHTQPHVPPDTRVHNSTWGEVFGIGANLRPWPQNPKDWLTSQGQDVLAKNWVVIRQICLCLMTVSANHNIHRWWYHCVVSCFTEVSLRFANMV